MNKWLFVLFAVLIGFNATSAATLKDSFVDETLRSFVGSDLRQGNPVCDFTSTNRVPIVLTPKEIVRSKEDAEGRTIRLEVKNNIFYRGSLLVLRGTEATAKVETITTQGMNGIPAMIFLDRFEIPGLDSTKMKSSYVRKGLNLTYLVLPIKWALTIFPPTGSLANFIIGGSTKITPRKDVTIYYYPDWHCL